MDAPLRPQFAKARHTDVQYHHIRLKLLRTADALQPIGGLTYDLESRVASQECTGPLSEHLMTIDNQNSEGLAFLRHRAPKT
jgi:hypothetical protein